MKVVAFNGSARKDGNTAILLNSVLEELQKERLNRKKERGTGGAPPQE
jgi:multimeric flavodoxin WrbA